MATMQQLCELAHTGIAARNSDYLQSRICRYRCFGFAEAAGDAVDLTAAVA
jgi:exoribonuclease II